MIGERYLLCVCVCVCVLFTERKRMKEKEIQVLKEERHCLGFFSHKRPWTQGSPEDTPPRPDAPPVSFGPPQPTDLQNNKLTNSTMDRPANQRELMVTYQPLSQIRRSIMLVCHLTTYILQAVNNIRYTWSDLECRLLTFNRLLVVFCHILSTTGE